MGKDRRVGRASALFAHQAHHMLPVHLNRETRRELMGHDDHLLVGGTDQSSLSVRPSR